MEATICHIIDGRRMLLKKATRGISVGKWNGPGGKVERGETPEEGAAREVMEETGLRVVDPLFHGTIGFYMRGGDDLDILVHVFSARRFEGRPRSTVEGRVRWFDSGRLPFEKMWDDDKFWIGLILAGERFDAEFHYDKENKKVVRYEVRRRPAGLTGRAT
jgi:8-oxo-dGTP diphosphatase